MIKYKLTDQKMQTYHGFQWELDKEVETNGEGNLCGAGWLHFYDHPLLALLHNPIHAGIKNPRLFEVEVSGKSKDDHGLKCGYTKAKLVREIPIPKITPVQRVAYGILCAKKVSKSKEWNQWADNWLWGKDRTYTAAEAAIAAIAAEAAIAANAAAAAAADAAIVANAAEAAANAAEAAAYDAADAAAAAYAAAEAAAIATADAAYDAADAADAAVADAAVNLDLIEIAKQAMEIK